MKQIKVLSDSPEAKKNETEKTILDLKQQIENKKNAIPDDPAAKLSAEKAIKDLEGRIITLEQSLPKKKEDKEESGIKQLKVISDLDSIRELYDAFVPKSKDTPSRAKLRQRYEQQIKDLRSKLANASPDEKRSIEDQIRQAQVGLSRMH